MAGGSVLVNPDIATSSSGQYVYIVYESSTIRVRRSDDYGASWANPTSTPQGTPVLSVSDCTTPRVSTNSTGQYVYAIWQYSSTKAQVAISSDYGDNWVDPTSTPAGTPSLASWGVGGEGDQKYSIATSSTGQYVYAVWALYSGGNNLSQVAISSDYGDNWIDPTSTPSNAGTPSLSDSGGAVGYAQVTTSSTGRFVYAIWKRDVIQVAISSNYGVDWVDLTTVTGSSVPDLSTGTCFYPKIVTNSTGKFVHVAWGKGDSSDCETVLSVNYGRDWINPTSTPGGTPKLGAEADLTDLAINSSGEYIYAVWAVEDDSYAQEASGFNDDTGGDLPTFNASGSQIKVRFPFQIDFTNNLAWNNLSEALFYRIYSDASLTNLIAELPPGTNKFVEHQIKTGERKVYYIVWVDSDYIEQGLNTVILP